MTQLDDLRMATSVSQRLLVYHYVYFAQQSLQLQRGVWE